MMSASRGRRDRADASQELGEPVLAGREFRHADAIGAPRVAIVNEAFTRKFNLARDAVGQRMAVGLVNDLDLEIVGIVADARYSDVRQEVHPQNSGVPYPDRSGRIDKVPALE